MTNKIANLDIPSEVKVYLNESDELNKNGNRIFRGHRLNGSRYFFDNLLCPQGWKQYDTQQDASYFGVWVNPNKGMVLTFAEGDISLVYCASRQMFLTELKAMAAFYGAPPPAYVIIDVHGRMTKIYDIREGDSNDETTASDSDK